MGNEERQKWEASKREVKRIFTDADEVSSYHLTLQEQLCLKPAIHAGITACQQLIKVGEYESNTVVNPKDARRIIRSITGGK